MKKIIDLINSSYRPLIIADYGTIKKLTDFIGTKKELTDIVYKTFSEASADIIGTWGLNARLSLEEELNIDPEYATILLKNSLFAREGINRKVNELFTIKNTYRDLLEYREMSRNIYKNRTVIIFNDYGMNDLFNICRRELSAFTPVISYVSNQLQKKDLTIYRFDEAKAEIYGLGYKVAQLLEKGISPDHIKINIFPKDYFPYFNEVFTLLGIEYTYNNKPVLFEYETVKAILKELTGCFSMPIADAFKKVLAPYRDRINGVLKALINVFNGYIGIRETVSEIYSDLCYELKRTNPYNIDTSGGVKVTDVFNDREDGDYIFIPACHQGVFPRVHVNDDYLSDDEKAELGLMTSYALNEREKIKALNLINEVSYVYISYTLKTFEGKSVKSGILDELSDFHNITEQNFIERKGVSYSKVLDKIRLGKYLDLYYKYDVKAEPLFTLLQAHPDHAYLSYDNSFTGVDFDFFKTMIKTPFSFSYTSIDKYYKCPFLFYIERILGFNRQTNEDALYIGNLFHYILEKMVEEFPPYEELEQFLDKRTKEFLNQENKILSQKELFFLKKHHDALKRFYEFLKEQGENSLFEVFGLEKPFKITLGSDAVLQGKIDKILTYKTAGKIYAVVVDYKSGGVAFDLNNVIHGLNLQLPIYYYFLNNSGIGKYEFGGAYLEGVLPTSVFKREDSKTYDKQWNDHFKLKGYSVNNHDILRFIDNNYDNEQGIIYGIRVKNDGSFYKTSLARLLNEIEFDELLRITEQKIKEAVSAVLSGKFPIKPKRWGSGGDSCRYCAYRDICYREEDDYEDLQEYKDFSFLREDI